MTQPNLFDVGERLDPPEPTPRKKPPCTPAAIGSGPAGETCRTCLHKYRTTGTASRYLKCGLMRHEWTKGPGTDIRASWAACAKWEETE